jgi:ParB family transcriptional regulator, chromosome partitioning protein
MKVELLDLAKTDVVHELKTLRLFFGDVRSGRKPFELRYNDRNYSLGDTLRLREIDDEGEYTGREEWRDVTYLLTAFRQRVEGEMVDALAKGFVIMGLGVHRHRYEPVDCVCGEVIPF